MKYRQLTKEQFESLHEEFALFLATQSIDAKEWEILKKEKPQVTIDEMNVFSDVVWDDVLNKTKYLEHFSAQNINLFKCDEKSIARIVIKTTNNIDFTKKEGFEWLLKNPLDDSIDFLQGSKAYTDERNLEIFDLIEKGSSISKGELYEFISKLIT